MGPKKIAILLHARDGYPRERGFFIWALCDLWRQEGIEIEVLKGPNRMPPADVLIPHVDLTVLPAAYEAVFKQYPVVVNHRVRDISKRRISRQLLNRDSHYDGAVIVKTNLNFGGVPEVNLGECSDTAASSSKPWWRFWRRLNSEADWTQLRILKPKQYRIFPSLKDVPAGVFSNDALVVEQFLPEFENGLYYLRIHQFLGSSSYCVRLGSREPIVKGTTVVSREEVSVPDELMALRREWGLDYGKVDFVVRDGRVVLFDVNRTPGLIRPASRLEASAKKLAPGLQDFLPAG